MACCVNILFECWWCQSAIFTFTWYASIAINGTAINGTAKQQLNKEPTRGSNILELCISSQPEFVQSCTTGPGISDHDHIVIVKCKYRVLQNRKKTRSVHLCNKANWSNTKSYLNEAWEAFFMNSPECNPVDTNWAYFKNTILQAISKFVLRKSSQENTDHPGSPLKSTG